MASINERIGKLPLGKFHYRLLGMIASGVAFEALDTGLIAFVLAKMISAWNLSPAQIGFIGSAALLGMALALLFRNLGGPDRPQNYFYRYPVDLRRWNRTLRPGLEL